MKKTFLAWGFFFGLTAVILGAFAAHGLEKALDPEQIDSFQTGVRYQMYHAILLILLGKQPEFRKKAILYFLVIGTLLFSFSIYLLNLRQLLELDFLSILGPITPIGGTLLIIAWGMLLLQVLKLKETEI